MRLAYLTNRYGAASYTFIMTEVEQLRQFGHEVLTFSVRHPGRIEVVSPQVDREQRNTEYFVVPGRLIASVARLLIAALRAAMRPRRLVSALVLAHRTSPPGLAARARQAGYLLFACQLANRMRATGVSHLHNHLGSSSATIAMLASELSGIPYSLTIHGGWIFYEPRRWALGEKIRRSAFTACISAFSRSQCMLFTPHQEWHRLHVVRCGVDEQFLEGPATPPPDTSTLVSVGRLSEEKGQLLLLEAARLVVNAGVPVRLVLVGDGPMRPTLETRIGELQLQEVVRITGMVSPDQVKRELQAARALVLGSLAEGLPVAVMEALSQCRPVIATNVGAVAELVRPGETGWLVTAGSSEALAEAMAEALSSPVEQLYQMGLRGAALVAERHRAATEVRVLESLIVRSGRHE